MSLIVVAFIAGLLTALAPCVLPLLPIIVGGSLAGSDKRRPYVVVGSLMASLFVFTILLKVTTGLLGVPPVTWQIVSGVIVIILGITSLWPHLYDKLSLKLGFYKSSQAFLGSSVRKGGMLSAVLTGVALGPVFSSCSPTYALILATVLPVSISRGLLYVLVYILGLGVVLLAVILLGRKLTSKLGWALNPEGWFKRVVGIIFILVGVAILTGLDRKLEDYVTGHQLFNVATVESNLLPKRSGANTTSSAAANGAVFALSQPTPAPEFTGITNWINSNPLTLSQLRGKVVLVDFWTYSCINCIHTLPHVEALYQKYHDQGLVVVGVHAPEFSFEHVLSNVQQAVKDDHLTYPVALDNNFATWNAYSNQYWPAEYFIDREGNLRHYYFGEGGEANNELVIRALLAENGTKVTGESTDTSATSSTDNHSPETYLGYQRASGNANVLQHDTEATYVMPPALEPAHWGLGGIWQVGGQTALSGDGASLKYNFTGNQVYLVMGAANPARVTVKLNGQLVTATAMAGIDVANDSTITVGESRLYRIIKSDSTLNNATLELDFEPGVAINAFTFD